MKRWIVTQFDEPSGGNTECVIVGAPTAEDAAELAAPRLEGDDERIENVFVAAWGERVAMTIVHGAERSPLQCCGGPAPDYVSTHPHFATCPVVSDVT